MSAAVSYKRQEMLTISDVARRLGVSRGTVHNRIEEGRIKAFRFGFSRKLYVPLEELRKVTAGEEVVY